MGRVKIMIGNKEVDFLIDSGAQKTIIRSDTFEEIKQSILDTHGKIHYLNTLPKFKSASSDKMYVQTGFIVPIASEYYPDQPMLTEIFVTEKLPDNLLCKVDAEDLGVLLMGNIKPPNKEITKDRMKLFKQYAQLRVCATIDFENGEEKYKPFPAIPGYSIKIQTYPHISPKQRNFSIVPKDLEEDAKNQIMEWLATGVISRVNYSCGMWISSLLVIRKPNGTARCCVDFIEVNKAICTDGHKYRMPTIQDMTDFAKGGKFFSTMDLRNAFMHVELDESARWQTCFKTPWGLFMFNRIPFGLNIASEVFQNILDGLFQELPFVKTYLDDIIIKADSKEELELRKKQVNDIINKNNLHVNHDKTVACAEIIEFVGFMISGTGVKLTESRIEAIKNLRAPSDIKELRSFLGKINFVGKFVPNMMDIAHPLWQLLKETLFVWKKVHQACFEKLKNEVVKSRKNMHFDEHKKTFLITDASPKAVGAMLFQRDNAGNVSIVGFSSHLLSQAQQNYPHYQKEILGIVTAVEHFRRYLRGRHFMILTDLSTANNIIDKSLHGHYNDLKRYDKWIMYLREYSFDIVHVPGILNIADSLSRLCTTSTINKKEEIIDIDWAKTPCIDQATEEINRRTVKEGN